MWPHRWLPTRLLHCGIFQARVLEWVAIAFSIPAGLVVKNLPSNAGEAGLILGWRTKIPHALWQLCPWTATTEPTTRAAHAPQWTACALNEVKEKEKEIVLSVLSVNDTVLTILWKSTWYYVYLLLLSRLGCIHCGRQTRAAPMILGLLGFTPFYPLPLSKGRTNRMQQRWHDIHGYVYVITSHMTVNHLGNRPPIVCLVRYGLARSTDSESYKDPIKLSAEALVSSEAWFWGKGLFAAALAVGSLQSFACSWTEGLCSWLLAGDYLAMRCPLEALTTWPLASSEPVRESLWVILYTTRRLSYFNLLHLTGVNLHLQFMLGF